MERVTELYVVLDNAPGTAGQLCRILKKKQVTIYAIAMFIDFARLHCSNSERAMSALQENGYQVEIREVLRMVLPNQQGALMEFTAKLGNAGINVEYLYGAMQEHQKQGVVILEVDQPDLAMSLFENQKF